MLVGRAAGAVMGGAGPRADTLAIDVGGSPPRRHIPAARRTMDMNTIYSCNSFVTVFYYLTFNLS